MIRKCLFPAAGYGTRFLPATKSIPKEMLPIISKPLMQYGVEEALEAGMTDICIVTGRGKRAIEDHFDNNYELEHQIKLSEKKIKLNGINKLIDDCKFSYTRQKEMKGLGHAVSTGATLVGNEAFGVILSDDLCIGGNGVSLMSTMVELYHEHQCSIIAVMEVPDHQTQNYGIVSGEYISNDLVKISSMVEKPTRNPPSNLAIIGRYILTPDIFDYISQTMPDRNGEIQLTDSLMIQAREKTILAYKFHGVRFDCGRVDEYIKANNFFYEHYYI